MVEGRDINRGISSSDAGPGGVRVSMEDSERDLVRVELSYLLRNGRHGRLMLTEEGFALLP